MSCFDTRLEQAVFLDDEATPHGGELQQDPFDRPHHLCTMTSIEDERASACPRSLRRPERQVAFLQKVPSLKLPTRSRLTS
jgi:hypothetical protein